jgi:hypothetical protein
VQTFVVRLIADADRSVHDAAPLRLRGVVDEVASGSRATFGSGQELLAALMAAASADEPGPRRRGEGRVAPEPASGSADPDPGEE